MAPFPSQTQSRAKFARLAIAVLSAIAFYNDPAHAGPYAEFQVKLERARALIREKEEELSSAKLVEQGLEKRLLAYGREEYDAIMDSINMDLKDVGDPRECRREIYGRLQAAYNESDYPFGFADRHSMLTTLVRGVRVEELLSICTPLAIRQGGCRAPAG